MQVILLADIDKTGLKGEVVEVSRGFARNFLLPRRLAEVATPGAIAAVKRREAQRAQFEARTVEQATDAASVLGRTVLRFEVKAGPSGALFGSVGATDVADEIWRTRKIRVDRRKIDLEDPIKRIGRYMVEVEVFDDVKVKVKTIVAPQGGTVSDDELPEGGIVEAAAAPEAAEAGDAVSVAEAIAAVDEAEAAASAE
jgi:large subunit ribosomal protein L9